MRILLLGLLILVPCLGCSSIEEEGRKAFESNFDQLENRQLKNDQIENDQIENDQEEENQFEGTPRNRKQDPEPAAPEFTEFTHVITMETVYYITGPQQSRPPEGKFPAGTQVNLVEHSGSYVRVRSEGGIEAHVGADFVKQRENNTLDVSRVVESGNQFALDLYQELRGESGNVIFSPCSISTALAMTYAGAAGTTKSEMAKALCFNMPDAQLHSGMKSLQSSWRKTSRKKGIQLSLANRLWGHQKYEFLPAFLQVTRDNYDADLVRLDFAQSEPSRQTINAWVTEKTEGLIKNLIPKGVLNSDTRLVLTNAVYFKGSWANHFKITDTKKGEFHLAGSGKTNASFMNREDDYRYAEMEDLQILELPYGDGSFSMVVLLPTEKDGLAGLEANLTIENLQHWIGRLKRGKVAVSLPKFKTTFQTGMSKPLKAMGMTSAFDPQLADFSGMIGRKDLFISAVVHKAFIDVNEEGTEAAAATGVVAQTVASRTPSVFLADHPFVFMILDARNGSIIFMGRITNPEN